MQIAPLPWLERTFSFGLPTQLAPNLLERLRGTPARLEEKFTSVGDAVTHRPESDKWSIQEHVGHLLDVESLWAKRFEEFKNAMETLTAAEITGRRTWQANYNAVPLEKILREFRAARQGVVRFLELMPAECFERKALHPRLNTMISPVDLMYFAAEHDDYHLMQITRLMRV